MTNTTNPDYIIYTDGSSLSNPGPCGAAYLIISGDTVIKEKSIPLGEGTNNIAELTAAIEALKNIIELKPNKVLLFADSQYVVKGVTEWSKSWVKRNWKGSSGKKVLNMELWKELLALTQQVDVDFQWVKAHADNQYNERVDALAKEAAAAKPELSDRKES